MNRFRSQYLIHVALPLLTGGMLYLTGRTIAVLRINLILKSSPAKPYFKLPDWMIYNLPDGLWLYGFLMGLLVIWQNVQGVQPFLWFTLLIAGAIGSEFLQKYTLVNGTYDSKDILAYVMAVALCAVQYYQLKTVSK